MNTHSRLAIALVGLLTLSPAWPAASRAGAPATTSLPSTLPLLPVPRSTSADSGRLVLDTAFHTALTRFRNPRLDSAVTRALVRLERRIALPLSHAFAKDSGARLVIAVQGAGQAVQTETEDESYTLDVVAGNATLRAPTVVGAIRGLETLLQLVSADSTGFYLPAIHIADAPRFPWRGLLVDVGRHFEPVEVIKRTLDGMAAVKLNVLHWHLSEDQGFRVESRRYPRLQRDGSDGLYYTQEQIRDVVAYARGRGIRVVPEFDMPGHTTSWFVGYPQYASAPGPYELQRTWGVFDPVFDPTREEVYTFIDGFVAEMAALFPDPYWHIGGDEVNGVQWKANHRIQAFMRRNHIADNAALQAYFNRRLARILTRHGKRMVGWDEILHPDLPRTAVVQSWRGVQYLPQTVRAGHSAILSAPYYLDHQSSAEDVYVDPLPDSLGLAPVEAARILGGEACMWGEHVSPETIDSRIWPRLGAVAEKLWAPQAVRDVHDMYRRLRVTSLRLEELGLGHNTHTERMLHRAIGNGPDFEALLALLRVSSPVPFGQRNRMQVGMTQQTPLTRLVDAARPDPPARWNSLTLVERFLGDSYRTPALRDTLRLMFQGWRDLAPAIRAAATRDPLAQDGVPAAEALARVGDLGLAALDRLGQSDTATSAWRDSARAVLNAAAAPQGGMLRLVVIDAVRWLVEVTPVRQ